MGIDYTELAAEVQAIINDNGRTLTAVKKNNSPADPDKPWKNLTGTDDETIFTGVVGTFDFNQQDFAEVRRGDKKILAHANLGVALDEYDQVLDGSTVWNLIGVKSVHPGSSILLYILQVRI